MTESPDGAREMMELTTRQRAYLRSLGQHRKPLIHLGREGLTEGAQRALAQELRSHELVKVRVLRSSPDGAKEAAEELAAAADAVLVGVVGGTMLLYRPNPELKERIELPGKGSEDVRSGEVGAVIAPKTPGAPRKPAHKQAMNRKLAARKVTARNMATRKPRRGGKS
jgi:RNA-binding protein